MRPIRLRRLSPSIVVASLALLVALGGTGVAAVNAVLPGNSVGTAQLKNNAVTCDQGEERLAPSCVDFKAWSDPLGVVALGLGRARRSRRTCRARWAGRRRRAERQVGARQE